MAGSLLAGVSREWGASTVIDASVPEGGRSGFCVGGLGGAGGLGGVGGFGGAGGLVGAAFGRFSRMREVSGARKVPRGLGGSCSDGTAELDSSNVSVILRGCAGGAGVVVPLEGLEGGIGRGMGRFDPSGDGRWDTAGTERLVAVGRSGRGGFARCDKAGPCVLLVEVSMVDLPPARVN